MNEVCNSSAAAAVLVLGEKGADIDLGFIPSHSIFFNDWDVILECGDYKTVFVVDKNAERVVRNVRDCLDKTIDSITVVWNAERSIAYSYSMLSLAVSMNYVGFVMFGSTARLELVARRELLRGRQVSSDEIRSLLFEQMRKPSNLTVYDVDVLLEDQAALINEVEQLRLDESRFKCEVLELRNRTEQISQLHIKLRELQTEILRLRRRNDALARKALNKLTERKSESVIVEQTDLRE